MDVSLGSSLGQFTTTDDYKRAFSLKRRIEVVVERNRILPFLIEVVLEEVLEVILVVGPNSLRCCLRR